MLQGKRQDYQAALCTGLSLTMQRRTSSRAQQTRLKQQKRSWRGRTRHPPSPAFHLVRVSVDHNIYIKVKGKNCTTLSEMGKDPGKCLEERSGTARVESMLPKGQRGLKKKKNLLRLVTAKLLVALARVTSVRGILTDGRYDQGGGGGSEGGRAKEPLRAKIL